MTLLFFVSTRNVQKAPRFFFLSYALPFISPPQTFTEGGMWLESRKPKGH